MDATERYVAELFTHKAFADPNPKDYFFFRDFMLSECDETVAYGANRIGKTHVGSYRVATYLAGIDPYVPERRVPPRAKIWVITSSNLVPVIMEKLRGWLPPSCIDKWLESPGNWYIRSLTGAQLWVKTHDQERKQFQGQDLDVVWFDEEPPTMILNEVIMRLADRGGKIFWTATPREGSEVLHQRWHNLSPRYRGARVGPFSWVNAGFMQNPYLSEDVKQKHYKRAKETFKGQPDLFRICVLGEYVVFSGNPIFLSEDLDVVCKIREPKYTGRVAYTGVSYRPVEFVEDPTGWLEVWEDPKPGMQFTIGADVSMGLKDGDFSAAVVFNRTTHTVAALWHGLMDPYEFGKELVWLGWWYNCAILNPECNPPGNATINAIRHQHYPRLARTMDARGNMNERKNAFGAHTNIATKPAWVHTLRDVVANHLISIHSKRIAEEMKMFRRIPKDNKEIGPQHHGYAAVSGHDDCVMALIHAYMAHHNSGFSTPKAKEQLPPQVELLRNHISKLRVGVNKTKIDADTILGLK